MLLSENYVRSRMSMFGYNKKEQDHFIERMGLTNEQNKVSNPKNQQNGF